MTGVLDWEAGGLAWAITAAVALAAIASVWHYARAGRTVSRRRARPLLAVRLLTLTVLAATAWRPTLHFADDRPRPLRVLVDDSSSMALTDPSFGVSRYVRAVAAARELAAGPEAAGGLAVTRLDGRPINLDRPGTPSADASPLASAVRDAATAATATGGDTLIVLSDGRSTSPRDAGPPASGGAAVFTVAVAPEDRTPAVRAVRIEARPLVLAGQSVPVRVRLAWRNAAGRSAKVTLSDGRTTLTRDAALTGPDAAADFLWPAAAGPAVRLAAAATLDDRPAEATARTVVRVVEQTVRVLALAGPETGRDVGEAVGLIGGAPWVQLSRLPLARSRPTTLPAGTFDADVLVLADVPPGSLDAASWDALRRAVQDGGRSLLVLAGRGGWLGESAVAQQLAGLLPTRAGPRPRWVTPPPEQGVWPVPTRAGMEEQLLQTEASADADFRAWLQRPKMNRLLAVGPPEPGAKVLLADRQTRQPVLVAAAAGRGRTFLVLVDETWRWPAVADGDSPQRRFWLGLVRDASDLPYDRTGAGLSLAVDRPDAVAGQSVLVRTRTDRADAGPLSLTVTRDGVTVDTPALHEPLPGDGRATATLTLPPGQYDVTLRQAERTLSCPLTVVADDRPEGFDTAPDPSWLRRLAESTGGAALTLDETDKLPALLAEYRARHPRTRAVPLWLSAGWFVVIAAGLGLEWALRSEWGLA